MLTRRQFHMRLMAGIAAMALPRPGLAEADPSPDLWLNRLTFGANADARAALAALGLHGWLDDQLARPPSDPTLDARLAQARLRISYDAGSDENGYTWQAMDELRPLDALHAAPESQLFRIDWHQGMEYSERARPGYEVIAASLIRAVHAPARTRLPAGNPTTCHHRGSHSICDSLRVFVSSWFIGRCCFGRAAS